MGTSVVSTMTSRTHLLSLVILAILGLKLAYGHPMEPETDAVFGLKTDPKTEKSETVDAPMEIEPLDIDRHGHEHSMEEHDSPVFKTPVFESLEEFKYQTADDLWSEMHSAMGVPGQFVPKRQIPRIPHHQPIKSHHHPMHHPMLTEMGNKIVKG